MPPIRQGLDQWRLTDQGVPQQRRCGSLGGHLPQLGWDPRANAINQLKALIVGAPEQLRAELRRYSTSGQVVYCAGLRDRPTRSLEHRMTVSGLRSTALRVQFLTAEASQLEGEMGRLVGAVAP
jgi:hypothetical protein